jgi:ribosome modulation factor
MSNSPEEAWRQGRAAGADGSSQATNPFSGETDVAMDWLDGWLEGSRSCNRPSADEERVGWAFLLR